MPWNTATAMSLRRELVLLATQPDANIAQLCRRFGICRQTAYKWIGRYRNGGVDALAERSRRPHASPTRTPPDVEHAVLDLRGEHPAWGGRKISRVLRREDALGERAPAPSTVTDILRRHGRLSAEPPSRDHLRFEAEAPNDLWQMDFKGDFLLGDGSRCYPLTVTDDHSRFALCLAACADRRRQTVQGHLVRTFGRYGLPRRILCDNGPPWGTRWESDGTGRHRPRCTRLMAWLIGHGITVTHGRPRHPQTQGKQERFHRSLNEEVLASAEGGAAFEDAAACQGRFDPWRACFNEERPHEGIGLAVPASRYALSSRAYGETEPAVVYEAGVEQRRVDVSGRISFRGRVFRVGKGLAGERVGLRPSEAGEVWSVYYAHQEVWAVDLREPP
jgi:transposase InsO family protein